MEPREALVALNMIEHVGPIRVRQLLERFGDAPGILSASRTQLLQARNIGEETAEAIVQWEKNVNLGAELKRVEEEAAATAVLGGGETPANLAIETDEQAESAAASILGEPTQAEADQTV